MPLQFNDSGVYLQGMLDVFVLARRDEIVSRTHKRVVARTGPQPNLPDGIPAFLDQLVTALRLAESTNEIDHEEIRKSAAKQGAALLRDGATIEEVVHEYGDVCQTITELAIEQEVRVPTAEFRVMNLCLDDAIAEAVTKFSGHGQRLSGENPGTGGPGDLVGEMRHHLATVRTSFDLIKRGQVAPAGSTARVLEGSLAALSAVLERALAADPSA